jgi:hypothetical protein
VDAIAQGGRFIRLDWKLLSREPLAVGSLIMPPIMPPNLELHARRLIHTASIIPLDQSFSLLVRNRKLRLSTIHADQKSRKNPHGWDSQTVPTRKVDVHFTGIFAHAPRVTGWTWH